MRRLAICFLLVFSLLAWSQVSQVSTPVINTFAGGGPNNIPATAGPVWLPQGVAFDAAGNLYIAAYGSRRILKVDTSGTISVVAGNGVKGYATDGTPALQAPLGDIWFVAADAAGNVYFTESDNNRVRVVSGNPPVLRTVSAISGNPYGLVLAPDGHTLYFSDPNGPVIYRVDVAGGYPYPAPTIVAGVRYVTGYNGDNMAATSASLYWPTGLACDSAGNLYIADTNNQRVRKVDATTGTITTVAGTGAAGFGGDNNLATAALLSSPSGVAVDYAGNLFIADRNNHRVRKVDSSTGTITTYAGSAAGAFFAGDNGLATAASLYSPIGVAADSAGNVYLGDSGNHRVRMVSAGTQIIQTTAGNGSVSFGGDTYPAMGGNLYYPEDIAGDGAGNFYIADASNLRIRKVGADGVMTTVAGNGTSQHSADGSLAAGSSLENPYAVAVNNGAVYFTEHCQVRTIAPDATLLTVAGTATCGTQYPGDNVPAVGAGLGEVYGMAFDASGNLYIAGFTFCRIYKVDTAGLLTTFAGTGTCSHGPDGGLAASTAINTPNRLAFDSLGNLYFSEYDSHAVRRIDHATRTISTVAGYPSYSGYYGDDGPATSAYLYRPYGLSLDNNGNLYIADSGNNVIRRVDSAGVITTFAGTGSAGFYGDGGSPASAKLNSPLGVWVNGGAVFIADTNNNRIRLVTYPADTLAPSTTVRISPSPNGNGWNNSDTTVTLIPNDGPFGSGAKSVTYTMTGAQAGSGDVYGVAQLQITVEGITNISYYSTDQAGNVETQKTLTVRLDKTPPLAPTVVATPAPDTNGVNHTDVSVAFISNGDPGTAASGIDSCTPSFTYVYDTTGFSTSGACWDLAGNYSPYVSTRTIKIDRTPAAPQPVINTVAGGGPNHVPAVSAYLNGVIGVATDTAGNFYFSAYNMGRVYKVDAVTGLLTLIAGTGMWGYGGDGGPATSAELEYPWGVAVDAAGDVYIADLYNHVVRKVDASGIITRFAGTVQTGGYSGDGGAAVDAKLEWPTDVAVDKFGSVYIADEGNCNIRKVGSDGKISTFAGSASGSCGFSGDNGLANAALLSWPYSVAVDAAGNVFIADSYNYRIRKVDVTTGIITSVAGNGSYNYGGDGGAATSASLGYPLGVEVDAAGNIYISDESYSVVRKVDATTGNIATIAGTPGSGGFSGDGEAATSAQLSSPYGVAVAPDGTVYIADYSNSRVRSVDTNGIIHTAAGTSDPYALSGVDNIPATGAVLYEPQSVAVDKNGNFYFIEDYRVRKVSTSGVITTVAGNGANSYPGTGDGGPATSASLYSPYSIAVDNSGNLFISENYAVRKVDASGIISRYAGTWSSSTYNGDNQAATSANLYAYGIATDSSGNLFIADYYNQRIRKVDTGGVITTVAGAGTGGDGGLATQASLSYPVAVTVDGAGNIFLADANGYLIRRVDYATGIISKYAGTGAGFPCSSSYSCYTSFFSGDGGAATQATVYAEDLAVDAAGVLYLSDSADNRVRKIGSDGTISTVAGVNDYNDYYYYCYYYDYSYYYYYDYGIGDGGPAYNAHLCYPRGVAAGPDGSVYIADTYTRRIRRVTAGTTPPPPPTADVYLEPAGAAELLEGVQAHSVRVCNRGPDTASSVALTDTLSRYSALSASTAQGTCVVTPALVTCQLGSIAKNAEVKVTVAVKAPKAGWASHLFQATTADFDPVPVNNMARMDNSDFGNTPDGENISVDLLETATGVRATVGFARVTRGGNTTLKTGTSASPPSGFRSGTPARVFEISTGATFTPPIDVALSTQGLTFHKPAKTRLFHQENGSWVDRTSSVDVASGKASATTYSLSPFALFEPENHPPVAMAADRTIAGAAPGGSAVKLDASNSTDPDGDVLTFRWTGPFPEGGGTAVGVNPTVTLPLGKSTVMLVAGDGEMESAPVAVSVTVTDFDISLAQNAATIARGQAATLNLTVTPKYGDFNGPIALACPNAPAGITCAFSPSTITPGAHVATVNVTVSTAGLMASAGGSPAVPRGGPRQHLIYALWLGLVPFGVTVIGASVRRKYAWWLLLAGGIVAIAMLIGCGGGAETVSSLKPASSSTVTVTITGTSGSLAHSITATITAN